MIFFVHVRQLEKYIICAVLSLAAGLQSTICYSKNHHKKTTHYWNTIATCMELPSMTRLPRAKCNTSVLIGQQDSYVDWFIKSVPDKWNEKCYSTTIQNHYECRFHCHVLGMPRILGTVCFMHTPIRWRKTEQPRFQTTLSKKRTRVLYTHIYWIVTHFPPICLWKLYTYVQYI